MPSNRERARRRVDVNYEEILYGLEQGSALVGRKGR